MFGGLASGVLSSWEWPPQFVNTAERILDTVAFVASWMAAVVMENNVGVNSIMGNFCINTSRKGFRLQFYSRYTGVAEVVESGHLVFLYVPSTYKTDMLL